MSELGKRRAYSTLRRASPFTEAHPISNPDCVTVREPETVQIGVQRRGWVRRPVPLVSEARGHTAAG